MTAVGYASTNGDARKVNKSGDTLTGELTLPDSSPDQALNAASKGYVDAQITALAALVAHLTGATFTGAVNIEGYTTMASAQTNGAFVSLGAFEARAGAGFNGNAAIARPTVSGAKGGNTALASLIAALASYGLITDGTS